MSLKPYRPSLPTIHSSFYGKPETSSLKEKFNEFIGPGDKLPMYKDKPDYPTGRDRKQINGSKIGLLCLVVLGLLWVTNLLPGFGLKTGWNTEEVKWANRKEVVRQTFIKSWDYYAEHAWGMDEFHPISQRSRNLGCARQSDPGHCAPTGWIIVDALDTAMMMNLTTRVARAREWISTSLDFSKVNSEMSTFETTIRILGGLLSAHWLSTAYPDLAPLADDDIGAKGEDLYIEKAVDLADRLLGAFDTYSGIPLSSCILNTSVGVASKNDMGSSSTAEATTIGLEFKYVAKLTGEPLYWERAEKVMSAIDSIKHESGLVPIYVNADTGRFMGQNIRLGSRGDSYYEYLIKQYLQTGSRESIYLDMWDEAVAGIKKYLLAWSRYGNFTILAERPNGLKEGLQPKMDHLACFFPGTLALAITNGETVAEAKSRMGNSWGKRQEEDLILAEELMTTCYAMSMATKSGLAPEIAYFNLGPEQAWDSQDSDWKMPRSNALVEDHAALWRTDVNVPVNDAHNLQRPETIESLFYMWRITGNSKYREWGWQIFQAFLKHTAVYDRNGQVVGYTSIGNVNDNRLALGKSRRVTVGDKVYKDFMEGFWMSETLKYLFLLFEDEVSDWNDLKKIVINTEAHFLPRFDIGSEGKVWKTGWTRASKVVQQ